MVQLLLNPRQCLTSDTPNETILMRLSILTAAIMFTATPLRAQDRNDLPADCANATSQTAINACAARGYRQADSALTQAYQHTLTSATGARRAALSSAQRAWVTYRDAHCRYATIGYSGGSGEAMQKSLCLASLTRARMRDLEQAAANTGVGPGAVNKPKPVPLPATPPGGASAPAVTGTVTYRERMALPAGAVLTVRLEDVSRTDAPAVLVAERTIPLATQQVPIPFSLSYNASAIRGNGDYAVRAMIRTAGATSGPSQLLFTTTRRYAVITRGNPTVVHIMVERASAK
jgi:putative lipoprotein